jgi:hypothetical protein
MVTTIFSLLSLFCKLELQLHLVFFQENIFGISDGSQIVLRIKT